MKLLAIGDTHANGVFLSKMVNLAYDNECEAIIQLGDFGWFPGFTFFDRFIVAIEEAISKYQMPIYFIDGNHDNHIAIPGWDGDEISEVLPGLYYIPRGTVWEWDGVRYMGFGGATSIDQTQRVLGLDWWDTEDITAVQVEKGLKQVEQGSIDVLFSHDCHSRVPIIKGKDIFQARFPQIRQNRRSLQAIVDAAKPPLVLHGHYHLFHDTVVDEARVIGLDCDRPKKSSWAILQGNKVITLPAK